ncbi:hypothetical protein [Haloplanus aerogenes]|uniref:Uncharacterized protein n=1 Tax=Haloplanus aerogenes TaxID=660522 RepID=A0A3M0DHS5_9EURY|nr:hypothetical protein [Haloplanus aerogenes]AZH26202.1 hypothetical protein DU502_12885 [Haloplanus aerogenes]RMB18346.1 hypothetical protein ATH50_1800 [Haloplanus aerogenes]
MPSTNRLAGVYAWVTDQRQVTILVAILVALPTAYAFHATFGGDTTGGGFLLLMTLAVGVPTAYDTHWPAYDRTWQAVGWVFAACVVATVEFVGLYLVGTALGLAPIPAAIGAFLVTYLGTFAWLASR